VAVREFDGIDDRIVVDNGAIGAIGNAAHTLLIVGKPTTLAGGEAYLSVQTSGSNIIAMYDDGLSGTGKLAWGDDNQYTGVICGVTTTDWQILAVTKPAGTSLFTGHRSVVGSGSYTRTTTGTTMTGPATTPTEVEFGSTRNGAFTSFKDYRLAVAAVFNVELSNGQMDTIVNSTANISALSPVGLWEFNQASTATTVTDLTGGGADQTIINGTTVVNGDDPTWTFAGATWPPSGSEDSTSRIRTVQSNIRLA
jgi:hypothetical protein